MRTSGVLGSLAMPRRRWGHVVGLAVHVSHQGLNRGVSINKAVETGARAKHVLTMEDMDVEIVLPNMVHVV